MDERQENLLTWTKGWRNVYAEKARDLGYSCAWGGGSLVFYRDGRRIGFGKPKNRFFSMEALIAGIEAENSKRRQEEDDLASERLCRIAAGETPPRRRGQPRHSSFLPLMMAAAAIGLGGPSDFQPNRRSF